MVQKSESGRVCTLVAVSQGVVKCANAGATSWTSTTNNTGNTPPLNATGLIRSAANIGKLWFVDGTNWVYFNPSDTSVNTWAASSGTLPVDGSNNAPRLICTWRGRTVLSGIIGDPTNWFMSAVSDPTNWNYSPTNQTPSQAIAGSNAPQGLIADVVTALIPYTDDVMIFGGNNSIYLMQGDPMAGGQISLVSNRIGIAFGEAWTMDGYGNIYFVSNRVGVYSLVPGQQPQRISQQIEQLLINIDMGANSIRMTWDDVFQGFHIFVTPIQASGPTTHFFYETRTGAWWTDTFSNPNHNPLASCTFDGNTANDRVVVIGSWDGVCRFLDRNAQTDDTRIIIGSVIIGPILTQGGDEMILKSILGILGSDSNPVDYRILLGNTAEQAIAFANTVPFPPELTGTFQPGRNYTGMIRRASHIIYLQLLTTQPWRIEQVVAHITTAGKVRARGVD